MSKFTYEERQRVYEKALAKWGEKLQSTVAIEEMSEVIKEIADARIMLEQMCQMLNINDSVDSWMDYKVAALKRKVEK